MAIPYSYQARAFLLALLLAGAALLVRFPPDHNGDAGEYMLTAVALATHGTPDIRLDDIATARSVAPYLAGIYDLLEKDMRAGKEDVYAAFKRGRGGKVYAVHFFGYPALALLPYKALALAGLPAEKCFQVVNWAALMVLAAALLRVFGSVPRAAFGLALFMLCGGMLYLNWSTPEFFSAAALLAGLLLFSGGAPLAGAVLAGLAAQQNPTIVFFLGFAPLLLACAGRQAGETATAALRRALAPRVLAALALAAALAALPPLFNLWQFGVPNIIARLFTDPDFIGATRLHSFFFDLNQGLLLGMPAVAAALAGAAIRRGPLAGRTRLVAGACLLFTLALAVPALAVINWNSGAAGVMRYAFWAAMPLLFALLWRLRQAPRWRGAACAALLLAQAGCMAHALSYHYVFFSPLARAVLRNAPGWYHPEPEIFAERAGHHDNYIDPAQVYRYPAEGEPVKRLYHRDNEDGLCGEGMQLAPGNVVVDTYRGWRYVDGALHCRRAAAATPSR